MDTQSWIGKSLAEHDTLTDEHGKLGYRFLSLGIYGTVSTPLYAAVMVKRPNVVAQRSFHFQSRAEFEQEFHDQAELGFGPKLVSAVGSASNPRFASVFQKFDPIPLTRVGLKSGSATDLETIQGMNREARRRGLIPSTIACYGSGSDPRFAAVWLPNPGLVAWNADGILETSDEYVARWKAHVAAWCRPRFVSLQEDIRYVSMFADDEINNWSSFNRMTEAECKQKIASLEADEEQHPICLQGGGKTKAAARYSGIFVRTETATSKKWHSTGLRPNAAIDEVLRSTLQKTPGRQASLAIVHQGRLVYAAGYTWAEPGWPVTEPTTYFRIGSCSKIVSALAAYQLIEQKVKVGGATFTLDTPIQSVLKLKSPDDSAPADSRFAQITVRHLLEHTSGVTTNAHRQDAQALEAHKAAKPLIPWQRPVSAAMTDQYIASLPLSHKPGQGYDGYNNCGYYLLGRVLAKARATATPIEAMKHLFAPLGITRIRRARSLASDQESHEARYLLSAIGEKEDARLQIAVGESVMSDDTPLVPIDYGTLFLEKYDGTGGLSAAATDLAMLLALVISQEDSPVTKRSTIVQMLDNGVANIASHKGLKDNRAGHGWDSVSAMANDRYSGAKGGSLPTIGCWVKFKGDWGFVMNWATKLIAPYNGVELSTFMKPVMDVAKAESWPSEDLFPAYGLASL